jgi:phosphohistidine phosphatase
MNLYLVQHAEARPESEDPERRLSERGRTEIQKMARFAAEHLKIGVPCILNSGKARARETAEALAEALCPGRGVEATDGLDPMADPRVSARRVADSKEDAMLVGHLPHLSKLTSLLLCGDEDKAVVAFQMAGIVYLRRNEAGRWAVGWMVVPAIL